MKLVDPPELVALCWEDEDGEEQVAGWAMVLDDHVVGYVPDRSGGGAAAYTFESLDSAEWILGYSGLYPLGLRGLPGLTHRPHWHGMLESPALALAARLVQLTALPRCLLVMLKA